MGKLTDAWEKRKTEKASGTKNGEKVTSSPSSTSSKGKLTAAWEQRQLGKKITTVGVDTLASDISTLNKSVESAYSGWQSRETMVNTLTSLQSMYDRLGTYQELQQEYGGEDLTELRNVYKQAIDEWSDISNRYKPYKSANEYTNETTKLNELFTMSSSDIKPHLSGKDAIAYTTVDGQSITWQDLYNDARSKEYTDDATNKADFSSKSAYKKKDVEYHQRIMSDGLSFYTGVVIDDDDRDEFLYNYINGDEEALGNGELLNLMNYGTWEGTKDKYLSNEEIAVFNYLWETQGIDKATGYIDLLTPELKQRRREYLDEYYSQMAKESPIGASVASVVANLSNNMLALPYLGIDYFEDGSIDENSALYNSRRAVQAIRSSTEENIDNNVGQFFYRHGMNTADNIAAQAIGGFGAFGGLSKAITTGTMSSGAFVDTVLDAKERGLSDNQALALGGIAGTAEMIFESKGFDALFDTKTINKGVWNYFANNLKTELVGELATEGTNDIADVLIAQDLSKINSEYQKYIANGASKKEAILKIVGDTALRYADVAAGTIFSTGVMSGPRAVIGGIQQNSYNKAIGADIKANDRASEVFDIASNPEIATAYDIYTRYAKKGITAENASDAQLGRLFTNAYTDAQTTAKSKKSTTEQRDSAKATVETLETYADRSVSTEFAEGIEGTITPERSKEVYEDFDTDDMSMLVESGLESAEGTEAHTLATEYDQKLKDGKKLSNKEMVKLEKALEKEIRAEEVGEVKAYLEEKGFDTELAEVVTRKVRGEAITKAEAETIENSGIDIATVEEAMVSEGKVAKVAETSEASREVSIPTEKADELGLTPEVVNIVERKAEGKGLTISEAEKVINNEDALNVLAENGNEELVDYVKSIADPDKAKLFLSVYDGKTDLEEFAHSFELAVTKAEHNYSIADIRATRNVLSNEQVSKIYAETRIRSDHAKRNEFQKLVEKTAKMKAYKGVIDDTVIDYDNTSAEGKVNWNDISPERKKEITFVKGVAQASGMNLTIITDGKERGYNGAVNIDKNTIYIDIFAEQRVDFKELKSAIIPAFSHELTHWMEHKSPVLYRKISDLVFSTLKRHDGLSEEARIAFEINMTLAKEYKKNYEAENPGKTITIEEALNKVPEDVRLEAYEDSERVSDARSEIVARACEDMLSRSEVGKELFNSLNEKEQKTLIDKVKDIIENFKNLIKDVLHLYDTASREAKALRAFDEECDKLSKLWDEMLRESVEVNQALEKSGAFEHNAELGAKLAKAGKLLFNERLIDTHIESLEKNYSEESTLPLPDLLARYNKIIDFWKRLGGELNSDFLKDWNNKVGKDRTFSIFKKQVGYKYNVELSSMCKKGIPLFEAIDTIVKNEVMKELDIKVIGKAEKQILYDILKTHNFEIPCAICYVEQARQREGDIIYSFLNGQVDNTTYKLGWNETLSRLQTEMEKEGFHYEFPSVDRSIATDKYTPTDIAMDEETQDAFFKAVKKLANEEIRRYNKENKANRPLITKMDAESLKKVFKGKLPLNLVLFRTLINEPSSRFMIDEDILYSSMTTQNLASSHQALYSLFNSQGGAGGYKSKQGSVVYWGDILNKKWNPSTVRNDGGVRNQSNSDFLMYTLLDHAQMYIDFTAKGYYLQAYTKVLSELKLFGLSKGKINASFIPKVHIYKNADGSTDVEKTKLYAGLDENGNPIYDDIEGINHTEAFMLIEDAEYSKCIGGVCIGYSDAHISKLLDDNRIQLIIGFHDKSNDTSKRYKGAVYAKNYTGLNEATKIDSKGNLKAVHIGFNQFVRKAEGKFKKKDSITYNGKTYTRNDIPKLAADFYLEHCEEKGLNPAYSQRGTDGTDFSKHPNYYKLLADFSLYDSKGNYAPHEKVEYNMPDQVPYLDENGKKAYEKTEAYIKKELKKELDVRDAISESLADKSEEGIIPQFKKRVNELHKDKVLHSERYDEYSIQTALWDAFDHNDKGKDNLIKVSKMPNYFVELLGIDGDFYIYRDHAYENMVSKEQAELDGRPTRRNGKDINFHNLGIETMTEAMLAIENPSVAIADEMADGNPAIFMILPVFDENGVPLCGVVSFYSNRAINGSFSTKPHILLTIHKRDYIEENSKGRQGLVDRVNQAIEEGKIVDFDRKKMRDDLPVIAQRTRLGNITEKSLTDNLSQFRKNVKEYREKNKILYSERVTDEETLDFLNNQKTLKVYRAMQLIDGKLYPPMAARIKGDDGKKHLVYSSEIGVWEQATEHPELIKEGKFNLDKANGSSIDAAYNPYIHTSASPLNDQFSSAYKRDNLVTVEGEIPISELTSGYRAEFAKDSVGETKWHSGPVASKLKGDKARKVYLSRWFKPTRIVPDSEVASIVAKTLEGENISVPYKVVTPSLKTELEKNGVSILYSERDDTDIYDVMGEKERLLKENEKFKAEIERLNERLKIERKVTNGNYFNEKQLGAVAGHLRNISKSNMDKVNLMKSLKGVYSFIANSEQLAWEDVFSKCYDIADAMLAEAKPMTVVDDYSKHLLKEIRNTRISLDDAQKAEAQYHFGKNWNRNFMGKVIISNDGTNIDSQWQEWSRLYPEIFSSDTNSSDMISELYDIIDSLRTASVMIDEYGTEEQKRWLANEIYNQYWNVSPVRTTADKYNKRIKELNFAHRNAMKEYRDAYETRLREQLIADDIHYGKKMSELRSKNEELEAKRKRAMALVKEVRERKNNEIALAKAHGREMMDKYKDSAERRTLIQGITSDALLLNEKLIKNSKDKHIPEVMKGPVVKLLTAINLSSKTLLEKGIPTTKDIKFTEAFREVNSMLTDANNFVEGLEDFYGNNLADTLKMLSEAAERLVGDNTYVINSMSIEELKALKKLIKHIKSTISKIDEFLAVNHAKGIIDLALNSSKEMDELGALEYKGKIKQALSDLDWNNTTPYYAFRRFGPSSMKIFEAIMDGDDKIQFKAKEVSDFTKSLYTDKDIKEWEKKTYTFTIEQIDGRKVTFTMSLPRIMELYCSYKQEDASKHFERGITFKKDDIAKTPAVVKNIVLSNADYAKIVSVLDKHPKAKKVAESLHEYMGREGGKLLDEVSMIRFGIKTARVKNYYPLRISTAKKGNSSDDSMPTANKLFSLINAGFTKNRVPGAGQSIEIGSIFDTFANHMAEVITYNAMALPILDAMKWYRYKGVDDFNNEFGVKQSIIGAFGDNGDRYFTQLIEDINGVKSTAREGIYSTLLRNYKIATVGASLKTALLQPTAYPKALGLIDAKYLIKGFSLSELITKKNSNRAKEHCGIALRKAQGYGIGIDIGRGLANDIKNKEGRIEKIRRWSMKLAERGDEYTFGCLWNACELEIRDKRKDLRVGSKEFYDAIGKRLREVVYATQVADSVLTRSQMMRSEDGKYKELSMFMSEPVLGYNIVTDAFISYKLDKKRIGKNAAKARHKSRIARVLTGYALTNALSAAVETAFSSLYHKDDDEEEFNWFKEFLINWGLNMGLLGKIPYFKEFVSMWQGYDTTRTETQAIKSFYDAVDAWKKVFAEGKAGQSPKAVKNTIRSISDLSGLPFYTVYKQMVNFRILDEEDIKEMFEDFID